MPELPDIAVYIERLEPRIVGESLDGVRVVGRNRAAHGDPRLVDLAGRLAWAGRQAKLPGKRASLHVAVGDDGLPRSTSAGASLRIDPCHAC